MANAPTTNTAFLKAAIERLEMQKIPAAPLLNMAGLKPADVDGVDGRISLKKTMDFYELVATETGDPCFGLHVGTSLDPKNTGFLGYVLLNCATVEEAIDYLVRYIRLYADACEVDLFVEGDVAYLSYRIVDPRLRSQRQKSEMAVAFMLNVARSAIGNKERLREVHFTHDPPADDAEHRLIFQAKVRFARPRTALLFDRNTLRDRLYDADPRLLDVLGRHADDLLRYLPEQNGLVGEIRGRLIGCLQEGEPRIEGFARNLAMSKRTLQRRLREEGTSFRHIVDDVRRHQALAGVGQTDLPLPEIAYLTGYSDFSAFHHAFRRWTGKTPSKYREAGPRGA